MKRWVLGAALTLITLAFASADAPVTLASGAPEIAGTINLVAIDAVNSNGPPAGGNVRNDIGPVDSCVSISNGGTAAIDIVADSIPAWVLEDATGGAGGISADLDYNRNVVSVSIYDTSATNRLFFPVPAGTAYDQRDVTPDRDGRFRFDSAQIVPFTVASGEGVLARITLTGVGNGLSYLKLTDTVGDLGQPTGKPRVLNPAGKPFDITTVQNAVIAVGVACPADPNDADADGVPNTTDNCPVTPNGAAQASLFATGNQTDSDGDGEGDACQDTDFDSVPPDGVCGGMCPGGVYRDAVEAFLGTNPTLRCAADATANNEAGQDRWPLDFNDDQRANTLDVLQFITVLNKAAPGPPYAARFDLNGSGFINTVDVLQYIPALNKNCAGLADAADTCPGTTIGDATDPNGCSTAQVDWDADGICDRDAHGVGPGNCTGSDNCMRASNLAQTDTDGDGKGNACDPEGLGPNADGVAGANDCTDGVDNDGDGMTDAADPVCSQTTDTDLDFFTDGHELFMGTSTTQQCSTTGASDDESPDSWPADTNDSINVTNTDYLNLTNYIASTSTHAAYAPRFDLILDGRVSLADALLIGFIRFENSICPGPEH